MVTLTQNGTLVLEEILSMNSQQYINSEKQSVGKGDSIYEQKTRSDMA